MICCSSASNTYFLKGLVMVFNAIFNNISLISWWSVLLVEESTDLLQVTDKLLSHNFVSSTPRLSGIRTHNVSDALLRDLWKCLPDHQCPQILLWA